LFGKANNNPQTGKPSHIVSPGVVRVVVQERVGASRVRGPAAECTTLLSTNS